ncbi:helix-turn-helix transcriptional regulator [Microlunatus sp. GCM10028923]|uniref:helix-turn-helix transcriptional regulator n=1 Tax=Microlunatus sp. GCM10028923 TaxID=3273400 RepID=UPI0036206DCD
MAPLIGRTAELDRLAELVCPGDEPAGPPGLVLLSGDAGIGKTRLLTELAELAEGRGRRVVRGQCVDLGDSPLPYLPFLEIFGRLLGDRPDLDRMIERHPAFAPMAAGHRAAAQPDRGALIESAWTVLNELAGAEPLLVIIEDVHWADRSSLELISYLFARPCPAPLSIVVSYRSDDLHRKHPLRPVLAEWVRARAVTRLELGPLAEASARELIMSLGGAGMTAERLRQLVERSDGNAFFLEELAAAGAEQDGLPDNLADVLIMRMERVGPTAQRVARVVAVAGHPVEAELLRRVTELGPDDLDDALRDATQHRLLVVGEDDRFAFRHSLLAETVYRDLLPGERVRLHRALLTGLTEAVPGRTAEGREAELARHALAAGDHELALPASIRAAEAAAAAAGPAEALRHYEVAMRLAAEPGADADPAELAARAAECALAAGQSHRATVILRTALADRDLAPPARVRLLYTLATVGLQTDQPVETEAAAAEALSLLPDEPTPFRTRVLATRVLALEMEFREDEAMAIAETAAEQATEFDLPDALVAVRTAQAWSAAKYGDPDGMRDRLREAVLVARRHNDPAELRALYNLGGMAMEEGELAEAKSRYEGCVRRAAELGLRYSPFGLGARMHVGVTAFQLGDWDTVLAVSDTSGEAPPESARAALAALRLAVVGGRGGDAGPWLDLARPAWSHDGHVIMLSGSTAIDWYAANGDLAAAERVHGEAVKAATEVWQAPDLQGQIRLAALLIGQYASGLHRLAPADRAAAVDRLTVLADQAARAHGMGRHGAVLGPESLAWLDRLGAELLRLRWAADVDRPSAAELTAAWDAVLDGFRRYPNVYELARSEARLGAVLVAVGDRSRAEQLLASARAVATRLGAAPLLAEIGAATATGAASSVLTPRERQVLALVAEGRSNAQVARELVISTKTASVHVSNILGKLGAASRTEAATIARRGGLLD